MRVSDLEALRNWLDRIGELDRVNKGLIDDAIWYLKKEGNEYRAKSALKGVLGNYKSAGKTEAAKAVDRLL